MTIVAAISLICFAGALAPATLAVPSPSDSGIRQSTLRPEDVGKLIAERDSFADNHDFARALPIAQAIFDFYQRTNPGSKEAGVALGELANLQSSGRHFAEAEKNLASASKIVLATAGKASGEYSRILEEEASWDLLQSKFSEAIALFKAQLELEQTRSPNSVRLAKVLSNISYAYMAWGHVRESMELAAKSLALMEQLGPDSLDCPEALLLLGEGEFLLGHLAAASKYDERALTIQKRLQPMSWRTASCLNELAQIALRSGKYSSAKTLFEQAAELFMKIPGEELNAGILEGNLALVSRVLGRPAEAMSHLTNALALIQKIEPDGPHTAQVLGNLAAMAIERGELDKAKAYLERTIKLFSKLQPKSLPLAVALGNLGTLEYNRGHLDEAQEYNEQALKIREDLAPNSIDVSVALLNIGNIAYQRGSLNEAQQLYERALAIQDRYASNTAESGLTLSALGVVAQARGHFEEANGFLNRALLVQEKLSPSSNDVANTLMNLGAIALSRGRTEEADHYLRQSLDIHKKLDRASSAEAICVGDLALNAYYLGKLDEAQKLFSQSFAIFSKLGLRSYDSVASLIGAGNVATARKDFEGARAVYENAFEILSKVAPTSTAMSICLNDLGFVAQEQGRLPDAAGLFARAFAMRQSLAPDSLGINAELNNLGDVAWLQGNENAASKFIRKRVKQTLKAAASESEAGSGFPELTAEILRIFSDVGRLKNPELAKTFYDEVASLRGLTFALESRAKTAEVDESRYPKLRQAIAARFRAVKAEADWVKSRKPGLTEDKFHAQLIQLRAATNETRDRVASFLKGIDPRLSTPEMITLSRIQRELPTRCSLVEYLEVGHWDNAIQNAKGSDYIAFVVSKHGSARFVRLGSAAKIDPKIKAFSLSLEGDESLQKRAGRELYNALVRPLGTLQADVYIAADGNLNHVPFNALVDQNGRYLLETKSVSMLAGGRDLIEPVRRGRVGPSVVIAAPQFDTDPTQMKKLQASLHPGELVTRGGGGARFEPLAAADTEGRLVAQALGVSPITGAEATEDRLYSVHSPRVLHIATHGVFYPAPRSAVTAQRSLEFSDTFANRIQAADDPMLRSALIFAGANEADELRKRGLNDGWATALDISQIDLSGTELVVLSGCDTGAGDTRVGDGVLGLQRAFRFAGAQSLVMSLFAVPDRATQKLMAAFYKNWKQGMPAGSKLKALREAQLALLHDPKTHGVKNWAGFVLMGNR